MTSELPSALRVGEQAPGKWTAPHPESDPEGRDVVFSGQLLAQMIMVATSADSAGKEVKSVHAVFARAGRYSAGPLEYEVDQMHSGRAWASSSVTAWQGGQLLSRGLVLMNSVEPDLIRHAPPMPEVAGPEACEPVMTVGVFPGAEVRQVTGRDGSPVVAMWVRARESYQSVPAAQAVMAWSQPGMIIGAALLPHSDVVDLSEAHRSISTGVISHTSHFHEPGDLSEWLLFTHHGDYAGRGRIFGTGAVYNMDGGLVSTFSQDSMARRVERPLDSKSAM